VGLAGAVESAVSVKCRARGLSEAEFVAGVAESIDVLVRSLPDITEEDLAFEAAALEPSEAGDFEPGAADSVHPSPGRSH
jgi:hypothetical protein